MKQLSVSLGVIDSLMSIGTKHRVAVPFYFGGWVVSKLSGCTFSISDSLLQNDCGAVAFRQNATLHFFYVQCEDGVPVLSP